MATAGLGTPPPRGCVAGPLCCRGVLPVFPGGPAAHVDSQITPSLLPTTPLCWHLITHGVDKGDGPMGGPNRKNSRPD